MCTRPRNLCHGIVVRDFTAHQVHIKMKCARQLIAQKYCHMLVTRHGVGIDN
jgi:hypothetical protein